MKGLGRRPLWLKHSVSRQQGKARPGPWRVQPDWAGTGWGWGSPLSPRTPVTWTPYPMVWGPQHLSHNSAAVWWPASRPCLRALSKPLPGMTHGATRIHQSRNRKTGQRRSATLFLTATVKLRCCARAVALRKAAFPEWPHRKDWPKETRRWLAILGRLSSEGAAKGLSCQWMRNTSETRNLYRPHMPSMYRKVSFNPRIP